MPYGDRALLVEPDDAGQVLPIRACLLGVAGVEEVVPAARTLLVRFDPDLFEPGRSEPGRSEPGRSEPGRSEPGRSEPGRSEPGRSEPGRREGNWLEALLADAPSVGGTGDAAPETVTLPVRYDGDDLAIVATDAGCQVDEAIRRHCEATYTVAFCGFAPGFAYLRGLDVSLWQPRLASPRSRVPAGSVGIAGEFTGVYPRASPGGWRLLGRTDQMLWDLDRTPPALLLPGTRVRFEPV
jgi:allophanate hydrolase subunit 1